MKCPLLTDKNYSAQLERPLRDGDCIRDDCAWWDTNRDCCRIVSIEENLQESTINLGNIAKELRQIRPK
jgi:hypothetical protein